MDSGIDSQLVCNITRCKQSEFSISIYVCLILFSARWNQKYQSANSTLIKYRDMSGRVAMLCLILDCQKTKCESR